LEKQKLIIIGPAHPLRGGLASFNERLAMQFQDDGFDTTIYTFSLQYPNFLFPGTTQFSSESKPQNIKIKVCINSINPVNWIKVGQELNKLQPAIIVVRYWLPFMGPCLGTILRIAKKNKFTKVVCIADNIIPHEKRIGDQQFTKYFIKSIDAFVTMSKKVLEDLKQFSNKPAEQILHPLYDNFGAIISKGEARKYLKLNHDDRIILFFGFIRKYKGLDLLLEAMAILQNDQQKAKSRNQEMRSILAENNNKQQTPKYIKLLIAGEFYEDRKPYDELIEKLNITDALILKTDFIDDSEVKYYLCAADFVIQPYKNATQSGVTPLAYHFEKPMLVTNVGGLPDLVPDKKVGIIAEPNPQSIAQKIEELYTFGEQHFLPYLQEEKKNYSWKILTNKIVELANI
jgi:glycosyltransferase involved in cell wall biosynthesis